MRNLSYANEFGLQFNFHANQSHFHKNGFALRLALKQRHKGTRKWPIISHRLGKCCGIIVKSASPKISRIDRQKRNNGFFLIRPKEPFWWTMFGNDIKRFDFLFLSSKFAKLENSATGPLVTATRLEIWHMFNMLIWTYRTLSLDVLYTAFVAFLKLYSGLNFVEKCFLLQDS